MLKSPLKKTIPTIKGDALPHPQEVLQTDEKPLKLEPKPFGKPPKLKIEPVKAIIGKREKTQ